MANAFLDRVRAAVDVLRGGATPPASAPAATTPIGDQSGLPSALTIPTAGDPPIVDKYPTVLGPLLNPAAISSALRLGERGYMRRFCDILSELRETTPDLHASLQRREKMLAAAGWAITPAQTTGLGKRAAVQAGKIADDIRARLEAIPAFDDAIEHLSGGIYFGRSALDIEYFRDRRGIGVARLHAVYPKRLSYAANWRIHLYDESGNEKRPELGFYPGIDIRATWPDRFVVHEPRTMGAELPTRQGLGRVLVWAAMFWKWTARDWMMFAELFAKPWRVGTYPKGAQQEDIVALKQGLLQLSGLTTAVFPEGCKPYFVEPGRASNGTHAELAAMWAAEISKVVNGGTLNSDARGHSGNRALGEVHERNELRLFAGDGKSLSATFKRDLVRPLVRLNHGVEAAELYTPIFSIKTDPPVDQEAAAKRIFAFVDRGGAIDADEFRDQYLEGMRKPAPKAPLLQPMGKVVTIATGTNGETVTPSESPSVDEPKPAEGEGEVDPQDGGDPDGDDAGEGDGGDGADGGAGDGGDGGGGD